MNAQDDYKCPCPFRGWVISCLFGMVFWFIVAGVVFAIVCLGR